ncbi:MAG: hypothetical protein Q8N96_04070 [Methylovulum sp.]|nr:hypothetical protein [Methylovulum sp.]
MTRLPETVTSKFTELFAALHYAADDLKIVGQEAMLSGDFSQLPRFRSTPEAQETPPPLFLQLNAIAE